MSDVNPAAAPQWATVADWMQISGMRRTRTFEAIGRGHLQARRLGGTLLIDVPAGLAWIRSLPPARSVQISPEPSKVIREETS